MWGALWTVYLVWGSTYLAIRVMVETVPPLLGAGARFAVAGAVMVGVLALRRPVRLSRGQALSALVVGVLWGAWHIIGNVVLASGTYSGTLPVQAFLVTRVVGLLAGGLPAFRVLMVWVYARTESLLLMMLMHVSLTASTLILEPVAIAGVPLLVLDLVSILVWWTVVAVVVFVNRRLFLSAPDVEIAATSRMRAIA